MSSNYFGIQCLFANHLLDKEIDHNVDPKSVEWISVLKNIKLQEESCIGQYLQMWYVFSHKRSLYKLFDGVEGLNLYTPSNQLFPLKAWEM